MTCSASSLTQLMFSQSANCSKKPNMLNWMTSSPLFKKTLIFEQRWPRPMMYFSEYIPGEKGIILITSTDKQSTSWQVSFQVAEQTYEMDSLAHTSSIKNFPLLVSGKLPLKDLGAGTCGLEGGHCYWLNPLYCTWQKHSPQYNHNLKKWIRSHTAACNCYL